MALGGPGTSISPSGRVAGAGGYLALWSASHAFPAGFDPVFTDIQHVYDEIGETRPGTWPPAPPDQVPDLAAEVEASGLFTDVSVRRYVWSLRYRTQEYIDLLETFSDHRATPAASRELLYREVRRLLGSREDQSLIRGWLAILNVSRLATGAQSTP